MKRPLFNTLQDVRRRGRSSAVVTDLASGAQALLSNDGLDGDLALTTEQQHRILAMLAEDASGPLEEDGLFVRSYGPPWSLLLVGAVHISQVLAPMALLAGLAPTVIDPRGAFATAERFAGIRLVKAWPDEAMADDPPGPHTAVVTLTHDPKIDDPGLIAALRSPAFFVGALGSSRTHAKRKERLLASGFTEAELERIAAPVGLDLGGRTPAEIAVAVLAEVVGARHGRRRIRR